MNSTRHCSLCACVLTAGHRHDEILLFAFHWQEVATWDGSEDFGEQLGAYHTSATEAVDHDVVWMSLDDAYGGGGSHGGSEGKSRPRSDAAAALGARLSDLAGLPSGRRVSLLAGCAFAFEHSGTPGIWHTWWTRMSKSGSGNGQAASGGL